MAHHTRQCVVDFFFWVEEKRHCVHISGWHKNKRCEPASVSTYLETCHGTIVRKHRTIFESTDKHSADMLRSSVAA